MADLLPRSNPPPSLQPGPGTTRPFLDLEREYVLVSDTWVRSYSRLAWGYDVRHTPCSSGKPTCAVRTAGLCVGARDPSAGETKDAETATGTAAVVDVQELDRYAPGGRSGVDEAFARVAPALPRDPQGLDLLQL